MNCLALRVADLQLGLKFRLAEQREQSLLLEPKLPQPGDLRFLQGLGQEDGELLLGLLAIGVMFLLPLPGP